VRGGVVDRGKERLILSGLRGREGAGLKEGGLPQGRRERGQTAAPGRGKRAKKKKKKNIPAKKKKKPVADVEQRKRGKPLRKKRGSSRSFSRRREGNQKGVKAPEKKKEDAFQLNK